MCGIAGAVRMEINGQQIQRILAALTRRGPDGQGIYHKEDCTLLHTRLAIVDPAGGAQPMQLQWMGENYIITYNGELYNTLELRKELEKLGHLFLTHSDTEVLLHGYAQWGSAVLDRLNGIYAFGIWHEKEKRLFLARDRIGVKPLFFARCQGGLMFGSEIKALLAQGDISSKIDASGAAQILMFGPGRIPGSGVLFGIEELEPGCMAEFSKGNFKVTRYWKLTDGTHEDDFETTSETVRWLVTDAIKRQMVSDVPIGTFLSGGLDSSIISAVCAAQMREKGEKLQTFSVDYQQNDKYFTAGKFQPNADGEYIRLMEAAIGSEHHLTVLNHDELFENLHDATIARDLPGMADVDSSLLKFCGEIRKEVKVALSGECADEIFGGYPWYRDPAVRNADGFPWAQNTLIRQSMLHPEISQQVDAKAMVLDAYQDTLANSDIAPENSPQERRMKQMVNLNFKWFMQTLLDRKDRMSMYHGLEVRVPFCDYRIAEYLYRVPWEFKDYNGMEKGLLRHAVRGLLPDEVLHRKKSPYPKTHHPAYEKCVRGALERLCRQKDAPLFQLVDRSAVMNLMDQAPAWPWYGQLMTQPQTMAYLLQINDWMTHYKVQLV